MLQPQQEPLVPTQGQLGVRQLEFLAIGSAIGSGLFVGSAQALRTTGSSLLLAYAICAAAVYLVARCLGEMTLAFPREESFVDHVGRQLGAAAGLVSGWGFWSTLVLIGMAELTAVGLLAHALVPALPQWVSTALAFVVLILVNLAPVHRFGDAEVVMSSLKVLVILAFMGLALVVAIDPAEFALKDAGLRNLWAPGGLFPGGLRGLLQTLPVALFSFGGFELISLAAAETEAPAQAIPRAVNGLLLRFVIFYLGTAVSLLVLLPWYQMTPGISPFLVILERLHVRAAAAFLDIVLISCILSSSNALLFAAGRVLRTLARQGVAPARLGRLSATGVPATGVVVSAFVIFGAIGLNAAVPHALFGMLMQLVAVITAVNWILIIIAELAFRRQKPFEVPSFAVPWTPWSSFVVLGFLVLTCLIGIFW